MIKQLQTKGLKDCNEKYVDDDETQEHGERLKDCNCTGVLINGRYSRTHDNIINSYNDYNENKRGQKHQQKNSKQIESCYVHVSLNF